MFFSMTGQTHYILNASGITRKKICRVINVKHMNSSEKWVNVLNRLKPLV